MGYLKNVCGKTRRKSRMNEGIMNVNRKKSEYSNQHREVYYVLFNNIEIINYVSANQTYKGRMCGSKRKKRLKKSNLKGIDVNLKDR